MSPRIKLPAPPLPKFDADTTRRFLQFVMDHDLGVTELRVFKAKQDKGFIIPADQYGATLAGWYDSIDEMIVDLGKLKGVSGYITINPVSHDLFARSANKIGRMRTTTNDGDIVILRWLYIDIDPRRPADISSTDAELEAAVAKRDQVLQEHPDLARSAIWGKSGNGAWIFVLLSGYPPEEGHDLAAHALAWLANRYSDDQVDIDVKTKNPSRVGVIPGTVKCKGSHIAERPHRLATLDSPDRDPADIPPLDLRAWLEAVGADKIADTKLHDNGHRSRPSGRKARKGRGDDRSKLIDRATRLLFSPKFPDSISGEDGHGALYHAASVLVDGFGLTRDEAHPILVDYNQQRAHPPECDQQVDHKLSDAFKNHPHPSLCEALKTNGRYIASIDGVNDLTGTPSTDGDAGVYFERDGKTWVVGKEGAEPIANFTARIVENVTRHEAGLQAVRYRIAATHEDPKIGTREIVVPSDKYASLAWAFALGAEFTISAGNSLKDHLRCAVQLMSTKDGIGASVEHTSLGWITHKDEWFYLHSGGAIGADGPSSAVRVDLPAALARYRLPEPASDAAVVRAAVTAMLSVSDLVKSGTQGARGAAALVRTVPCRAVLTPFNSVPHFGGPSGNLKTSTARLILQHFSIEMGGRNAPPPAGWSDTPNALQRLVFDAACSVLVVDDMKTNTQLETAEIVIQAQGNLQSRTRMAIDQSLQQNIDPRGTIVSTGEIDPRTASTLGRTLVCELRKGDIDRDVLTRLQRLGDSGMFATAMATYTRWLAPQLDEVRLKHARLTAEIRDDLLDVPGAHSRHPEAIAQLIAAYRLFLEFAVEVGSISPLEAEGYAATTRDALLELIGAQAVPQEEAKAGRKFLDLIAAALRSKRYHLADVHGDGSPQNYAGACGWHKDWVYKGNNLGQQLDWCFPNNSKLIGFINEADGKIYLNPTESIAVASEQARRQLTLQSFTSIGRELLNEGLCEPHSEANKVRATAYKRIQNHGRERYFWIAILNLFGECGSTDA